MTLRAYLTPPDVAKRLGISHSKVLLWIANGDLIAANAATRSTGERPRYLISEVDLASFLQSRSATTPPPPKVSRRRRKTVAKKDYFPTL